MVTLLFASGPTTYVCRDGNRLLLSVGGKVRALHTGNPEVWSRAAVIKWGMVPVQTPDGAPCTASSIETLGGRSLRFYRKGGKEYATWE